MPSAGAGTAPEALQGTSLPLSAPEASAAPRRFASVDVARGLTLMFMIVVNHPGSWDHVYAPLLHAHWHGFTPTDFVFPSFLFLVGVSIAFSLARRRRDAGGQGAVRGVPGVASGDILSKVFRRGAVLFLTGLAITAVAMDFDFAHLRIPGVLQRIAVVSIICSLLFLKAGTRTLRVTAFALLAAYYVLMNFVPVPGHGPANLEAATQLGAWLDRLVFTSDHLWSGTRTWDPEGLLSTVPAVSTGLFGVLAGLQILREEPAAGKLRRLLVHGAAFTAGGVAAHFLFPINKSLWTSSYVLLTAGLALLLLAACYRLVDMRPAGRWTVPFLAFGMNSIFAYVASEMLIVLLQKIPYGGKTLFDALYANYAGLIGEPKLASLAWALSMLAIITFWVGILYRKRIFLKI